MSRRIGSRTGARAIAATLAWALLSATAGAQEPAPSQDRPAEASPWVVPPGLEPVVERLATVPPRSKTDRGLPPADAKIAKDHLDLRWTDGRRVQLAHPDAATPASAGQPGSVRTERFAVTFAGTWSDADREALLAHVRAHEAEFRWVKPARDHAAPAAAPARRDGPDPYDAAVQDAERSLRIGEKDKALARLRRALAQGGGGALGLAQIGALLHAAGQPDGPALHAKAVAELAAAAGLPGARPDAAAQRLAAVAALQPGPGTEATLATVAALPDGATTTCAYVEVARSLQLVGRTEESAKVADAVRKKAPECRQAWLQAIGVRPHKGDAWKETLALCDEGLKRFPNDIDLLFAKGGALHAGWRNDEAAAVWEQVAAANLQHPGILGMLATAYTQPAQVTDDAFLARFEERLRGNPKDVPAQYVLGTIHYYRDEFQKVLDRLEPLLTVVPNEPRVYLYTAMSRFHLGDVKGADERLAALARLGHDDADFYYCRSVMLRHRDFEQSLRDLETFEQLSRGRQNLAAKDYKVVRELEVMRGGRVPNAFDLLPGPLRAAILGGGVLLLGGSGLWLLRRRKG